MCEFMGAVVILADDTVFVLFSRSSDSRCGTETRLSQLALRGGLSHHARPFPSLDAALTWADLIKRHCLTRGWHDVWCDDVETLQVSGT